MDFLSDMTLGQITSNAALILVALSAFVEITPIKLNPLSAIMRWIGDRINRDLLDKVEEQDKKMDRIMATIDKNEIDRIRWEILEFANSCRNNRRHTEDEFTHIIELNQKYHEILDKHKMKNGKIDLEYDYIKRIYKHCQDDNSFL